MSDVCVCSDKLADVLGHIPWVVDAANKGKWDSAEFFANEVVRDLKDLEQCAVSAPVPKAEILQQSAELNVVRPVKERIIPSDIAHYSEVFLRDVIHYYLRSKCKNVTIKPFP